MATWTAPYLRGDWMESHKAAIQEPNANEIHMVLLLRGWCLSLVHYGNKHHACIAHDEQMGPAWVAIAGAMRRLINDDIGRLSPGIIDSIITHNLVEAGIRPDALEYS
jgi:hypothetical protein